MAIATVALSMLVMACAAPSISSASAGVASSGATSANAQAAQSEKTAPAAATTAAAATPDAEAQQLVATKCAMCHNIQIVKGASHSPDEWVEVVTMMRARGAILTDQQASLITDYLAKTQP